MKKKKQKTTPKMSDLPTDQPWLGKDEVASHELAGNRAGHLLFRHRREDYKNVCRELANGRSVAKICRDYNVSPDVVIAVRRREGIHINQLKGLLSDKMALASQMATEAMIEGIMEGTIKHQNLAFATAVMTDKAMLLGGQATQRVEVREGPSVAQFADIVDALPAEVVEVEEQPEKGSGETVSAISPPGPPPSKTPEFSIRGTTGKNLEPAQTVAQEADEV